MKNLVLKDITDWDNEPTQPIAIMAAVNVPEFLALPPEHWSNRLGKAPSPSFNEVDAAAWPKTVL